MLLFPFGSWLRGPFGVDVDDFRPRTLRPTIEDVAAAHMALIAARAITGVDEMIPTTGVTAPKRDATDNAPKRIEIQPWSGNCEAKSFIQFYAGEPHLTVVVASEGDYYGGKGKTSVSLCMKADDARKLRDVLNEKYPGYVAPPTKSYKVKTSYSGQQIVKTETKAETKETIVATFTGGASLAEMDKMLASLRA